MPVIFEEHRPEHYVTRATTVDADPNADCPLWKKFLLRIMGGDQDMVDYLQRVCGYCLTGSTEEHAMFFGWGTGANGKSTFSDVLIGIFGTGSSGYAAVAPISTFLASNTEQHPTDLAMLQGVRLVIAQETEQGRSWATSKLKMMTGGDRITARFMRQDFFTYVPRFKIMILGNHKPMLGNVDEAIRRRLHLIPFTVTIPENERDPMLGEKLKAEGPAILWWMMQGCEQWDEEKGLGPPAKVPRRDDAVFRHRGQCRQLDRRPLHPRSRWLRYPQGPVRLLEVMVRGQRRTRPRPKQATRQGARCPARTHAQGQQDRTGRLGRRPPTQARRPSQDRRRRSHPSRRCAAP